MAFKLRPLLLSSFLGCSSGLWADGVDDTFSFSGYMRSGIGFSKGMADQECFSAPGSLNGMEKYRLGNECDTYVEVGFGKRYLPRAAFYLAFLRL